MDGNEVLRFMMLGAGIITGAFGFTALRISYKNRESLRRADRVRVLRRYDHEDYRDDSHSHHREFAGMSHSR
jgi:hypothetical protein